MHMTYEWNEEKEKRNMIMIKTIQWQCKFVLEKHNVYFYNKRSLDSFNKHFRKNANITQWEFIFAVQQFFEF